MLGFGNHPICKQLCFPVCISRLQQLGSDFAPFFYRSLCNSAGKEPRRSPEPAPEQLFFHAESMNLTWAICWGKHWKERCYVNTRVAEG